MKKHELRSLFKEKRKGISVQEMEKLNDLILINFQRLSIPPVEWVHTYLASLKLGEPDTAQIIRFLQFRNPLVKIVVPKIDIHSGNINHYHFEEGVELITNFYGIEEPKSGKLVSEEIIDLVLIPLLSFDRRGYRVGFGKGYYDKFLGRCKPNVIKIGLSFFDPVDEIEDVNGYDIPLNFCITPQESFSFSL